MKQRFDPDLPMTLILSLLEDGQRCACRGNLIVHDGMLQDVVKCLGAEAWQVLNDVASDIKLIRPSQVAIYTNCASIVNALAPPVRIETDKKIQWQVLYKLLTVNRWRVIRVEASNLKRAKELLNGENY